MGLCRRKGESSSISRPSTCSRLARRLSVLATLTARGRLLQVRRARGAALVAVPVALDAARAETVCWPAPPATTEAVPRAISRKGRAACPDPDWHGTFMASIVARIAGSAKAPGNFAASTL